MFAVRFDSGTARSTAALQCVYESHPKGRVVPVRDAVWPIASTFEVYRHQDVRLYRCLMCNVRQHNQWARCSLLS